MGEQKVLTFGAKLLEAIAQYIEERCATPAPLSIDSPSPLRQSLSDSAHETLRLFREGQSISAMAEMRNVSVGTIEEHLAMAVEVGHDIDLDRLVSAQRRAMIEVAFDQLGFDRLAPAKELLGDDFSYGELKLVRAHVRQGSPAGSG